MEILFFDLETTGTNVAKDRIVQISAIKIETDRKSKTSIDEFVIDKKKILINPECKIPKEASDVHRIKDEDVANAFPFSRYSKSMLDYFSNITLAGYNIQSFDIPLLHQEFSRCGLDWKFGNVIDCFHIFRSKEERNLAAALRFYCGKEIENAHDAEYDNIATIDVMFGQIEKYGMNVEDMIEFCCNHDKVDLAGTLLLKEDNIVYGIGKDKGRIVKDNPGFARWMLKQDFTFDTKNNIREMFRMYGIGE